MPDKDTATRIPETSRPDPGRTIERDGNPPPNTSRPDPGRTITKTPDGTPVKRT
jgi:hypothetical protein